MATWQRQADFEAPVFGVLGASTSRRPDAVALDELTAWTTGPIAIGDLSLGLDARVWRLRIEGLSLWLARNADDGMRWLDERRVLDYAAPAAHAVTLGFTSAGVLVVVLERPTGSGGAPELWLASTEEFLL